MRKARFTEHQIIAVLKSVEASYYNWKPNTAEWKRLILKN